METYKHIFTVALSITFAILWIVGILQIQQAFNAFPKDWLGNLIAGYGLGLVLIYLIAIFAIYVKFD